MLHGALGLSVMRRYTYRIFGLDVENMFDRSNVAHPNKKRKASLLGRRVSHSLPKSQQVAPLVRETAVRSISVFLKTYGKQVIALDWLRQCKNYSDSSHEVILAR